jgi:hypothetical protein
MLRAALISLPFLASRPGQAKPPGPIDDGFPDSFTLAGHTAAPLQSAFGHRVEGEPQAATPRRRSRFDGDAPVHGNRDVTGAGFTAGNRIPARTSEDLPVKWLGAARQEDANAANSRQYPRLPGYAVSDNTAPAGDRQAWGL